MTRGWSVLLSAGLAVLWIGGLGAPEAVSWITWLDLVGALWGMSIAAGGPLEETVVAKPLSLAVLLFGMWAVGLATAAPAWQCWWNFAFAALVVFAGFRARRALRPTSSVTRIRDEMAEAELRSATSTEKERFRRSA